jgi:hypothetical protein
MLTLIKTRDWVRCESHSRLHTIGGDGYSTKEIPCRVHMRPAQRDMRAVGLFIYRGCSGHRRWAGFYNRVGATWPLTRPSSSKVACDALYRIDRGLSIVFSVHNRTETAGAIAIEISGMGMMKQ